MENVPNAELPHVVAAAANRPAFEAFRGRGDNQGRGRGGRGRGDRGGFGRGRGGDRGRGGNRGRGDHRGGRGGQGRGGGHGAQAPPPPVAPGHVIADPAGVPPQPVAAPVPPTRGQVVNRWLADFRPRVARPLHEAAIRTFPGVTFLVEDPGVRGVNPHELLAVGRIIATAQSIAVLALEHRGDDIQHIDFLWGANRDVMVLETLNTRLTAAGFGAIEHHMVGDQVLAADQHRRPLAPEGPHSPYALMVNVYCHGDGATEVTPPWLATLGYEHLVWVGHRFSDLYGALLTGYWVRVATAEGPRIRWFADEMNAEYPPHPACDLMHTAGAHQGVQWHTVRSVTCQQQVGATGVQKVLYDLVLVSARIARESALHAARETKQIVVEVDIPDSSGYLNWVHQVAPPGLKGPATWAAELLVSMGLTWLPSTKVTLHKADFHAAVRFLSNKGRQQYSFRALQTDIERMLTDQATHADFIYLERVAPEYFLNYRWNLAIAAFTYNAEAMALQTTAIQQTYGAMFDTTNRAVRGIDTPVQVASSGLAWYIAAAIGSHLVLSRTPGLRVAYRSAWRWVGRAVVSCLSGGFGAGAGLPAISEHARAARDRVAGVMRGLWGGAVSSWVTTRDAFNHGRQAYAQAVADQLAQQPAPAPVPAAEPAAPVLAPVGSLRRVAEEGFELGFGMFWTVLRVIASETGWAVLVVAPLMEEGYKTLFKRLGPRGHAFSCGSLGVMDAMSPINAGSGGSFVINAVTMSFLHHWFSSAPTYWGCVKRHAGYNLFIICVQVGLAYLRKGMTVQPLFGFGLAEIVDALGESWWLSLAFVAGVVVWSLRARTPVVRNPVAEFDEYWYTKQGDPAKRQPITSVDESRLVVKIPEEHRYVAPFTAYGLGPHVPDPTVTLVHSPTAFSSVETNEGGGYYRVFGHNAPMFRPAGSAGNMLAVVHHRLAAAIAYPEPEPRGWWLVSQLLAGQCHLMPIEEWPEYQRNAPDAPIPLYPRADLAISVLDAPELFARWLVHTDPAKRERYISAHDQVLVCPLSLKSGKVRNIQVNVKKDEVLLKYRLTEVDKGMIPRPIHNVDPQLAVTVGPEVYAATEIIKKQWRWDSEFQKAGGFCVNGRFITLTYGAGLLSTDLDDWFEFAISTEGYHILVAGDDSVVVHTEDGYVEFIEGDISKCDHSVRTPALELEYNVLAAGGLRHAAIELLFANSGAVCVAATRLPDGGTVRVMRHPERNTGGVDTTVGNTAITGGAHMLACAMHHPAVAPEVHFRATFASLGLDLKSRVWRGRRGDLGSSFWGPSFLKGYWYPTQGGPKEFMWGPLPSRMLKISKIMVDPRRVYRRPGERDLTYKTACQRHVASLHLGLRPYAWPDQLHEWLRARADPAWTERKPIEEWEGPWRPKGRTEPVSISDRWVTQAAWWYQTSEEEVLDWLAQLQLMGVGAFSFHPFWVRMALKDYN